MARLKDLPIELLTMIYCQCHDIKSVLHLSSTCRELLPIWHSNAPSITCAIFAFSPQILTGHIRLSELEASTPEDAPQTAHEEDNFDVAVAVRKHLSSLERWAFVVADIRDSFRTCASWLNAYPNRIEIEPAQDFDRIFLLLRRLAVGHEHTSSLTAAYASVRDFLPDDYARFYILTSVVKRWFSRVRDDWKRLGFADPRCGDGMGDHNPHPHARIRTRLSPRWSFGLGVFLRERFWRPDLEGFSKLGLMSEDSIRYSYNKLPDSIGKERFERMFGDGGDLPWAKERAEYRAL
jgi:hypothetical protein